MTTGLVYHDQYLRHDNGPMHPESPQRLSNLMAHLRLQELWGDLAHLEPEPAEVEDLWRVHTKAHVITVREACGRAPASLDMDTAVSEGSWEAALLAVGGVCDACDKVIAGDWDNAFCAVRPPGHHAESNAAMGFCLFNNVAAATCYMQATYDEIERVLIVDWDVHHGNGTQEIFYDDPSVFYFSVHQFPHYPGSGAESERGTGEGRGMTLNAPLMAYADDSDYEKAFTETLVPAAREFDPDFILISAGFDAHRDDPLAGMLLSDGGYAELTRIVCDLATECCQGRVVSVLEGGYDIQALCRGVQQHLQVLMGMGRGA